MTEFVFSTNIAPGATSLCTGTLYQSHRGSGDPSATEAFSWLWALNSINNGARGPRAACNLNAITCLLAEP